MVNIGVKLGRYDKNSGSIKDQGALVINMD